MQWITQFLNFYEKNNAPLDFVSTHIYPSDDQAAIFGAADKYKQYDVVPAGIALARRQIDTTQYRGAELWLNEWSADSPAMIAHASRTACLIVMPCVSGRSAVNMRKYGRQLGL